MLAHGVEESNVSPEEEGGPRLPPVYTWAYELQHRRTLESRSQTREGRPKSPCPKWGSLLVSA